MRHRPPARPFSSTVHDRRLLESDQLDGGRFAPLWPAYRVLGMQAPEGSGAPRLSAFSVLWRAALDDLADGLVRRLAANRVVGVATLFSGSRP
jgi:hypothetical protein